MEDSLIVVLLHKEQKEKLEAEAKRKNLALSDFCLKSILKNLNQEKN